MWVPDLGHPIMFSLTCIKQAYKAMITQSIMFESKRRTYYNPHPFKARRLSFLKIFLVLFYFGMYVINCRPLKLCQINKMELVAVIRCRAIRG